MKRTLDMLAFVLIAALFALIIVLTVPTEAEDEPAMHDHCGEVTEMVAQPFEDPQESEKIEAALDWHYIEDCTLTAYCACSECCGKEDGITATDTQAREGVTIAVDPGVIPLGAWVEVNGHQYHAEDVGAFSGNHIDIFFSDHDEAWEFGRQHANVRWYPGC